MSDERGYLYLFRETWGDKKLHIEVNHWEDGNPRAVTTEKLTLESDDVGEAREAAVSMLQGRPNYRIVDAVAEDEMEPEDARHTNRLVCPYCGEEIDDETEKVSYNLDRVLGSECDRECVCPYCKETVNYDVDVSVKFIAKKTKESVYRDIPEYRGVAKVRLG